MPLALLAHVAFWVLVLLSGVQGERRRPALFVGLWVVGYVLSGLFPFAGAFLFGSYVALLDVVMLILLQADHV